MSGMSIRSLARTLHDPNHHASRGQPRATWEQFGFGDVSGRRRNISEVERDRLGEIYLCGDDMRRAVYSAVTERLHQIRRRSTPQRQGWSMEVSW